MRRGSASVGPPTVLTDALPSDPLNRTYAPFLHNTITRLVGVPRTYAKLESTDWDMFLGLTKADDFGGSAISMPNK